jgi:citrate synthase
MKKPDAYLDAATAAQNLGISRATLYAYVSRGLVHTAPAQDDPRRRLYSAHDIAALQQRKSVGRRPRVVAETALDWGLPVLASGLTLIENGRLFYRGQDAASLADHATIEDIARLLWGCGTVDPFEDRSSPPPWDDALLRQAATLPFTERCQMLLPLVAEGRATAWKRKADRLWPGAARLVAAIAAAATGTNPSHRPIHAQLAAVWGLDAAGADLIRRALVLVADHELNVSAFAVRVVASTGASLGACLTAGLSGLSGPRHGGTTSLIEVLFDEIAAEDDIAGFIERRLRRGDGLPGFDHPLYPEGDPRAAVILPHLAPDPARNALLQAVAETTGSAPNIDFALVSLRRALGLPPGTALALFAIGRSVGWIAHALEQHGNDKLIRPRARYDGPAPDTVGHALNGSA